MTTYRLALYSALAVSFFSSTAAAQDAAQDAANTGQSAASNAASVDATPRFSSSGGASSGNAGTSTTYIGDDDYIERLRPEPLLFEFGLFGGAMFPSDRHNLLKKPNPHQPLDSVVPEIGLRLGFYPLCFLGAELEGAFLPTETEDGEGANLLAGRGHLVAQLPVWAISPFLLGGYGVLASYSDSLGDDSDGAFHFGGGLKLPVNDFFSVRFDVRDTISQKYQADDNEYAHHPEVLLGLSGTLGRSPKPVETPPDRDGDGYIDSEDACPDEPGVEPNGCPLRDSDGDGFLDKDDQCPQQAGVAPDGCPIGDEDGDGFPDDKDKCPKQVGIAPDGCPDMDPD